MPIPHNWQRSFQDFLTPYLETLDHPKQRACLPRYLRGLLAPLERKSVQPIAEHLGVSYQTLHHFLNSSTWNADQVETAIAKRAQQLCGGKNSVLIIDDTALPKSGQHSVGVAHQYCGALGKLANCQALVTLTLANEQVFAPLAMRLFLPSSWTDNPERCEAAGVPFERQGYKTKGELALQELDRVLDQGVTFRIVLADAGYGISKDFRQALTERGLTWAVGVVGTQKVYGKDVVLHEPQPNKTGRPGKHPVPSEVPRTVKDVLHDLPPHKWHTVRGGRKSRWVARRVRIADGARNARGSHLPGDEVWLVGEKRRGGEMKYYVTNHPPSVPLTRLARDIKARWACETLHAQAKEELGLDHFEGRSLRGLEHHVVLVLLAVVFLQSLRVVPAAPHVVPFTLPKARREVSRALEYVRLGRCPHCGEQVRRSAA